MKKLRNILGFKKHCVIITSLYNDMKYLETIKNKFNCDTIENFRSDMFKEKCEIKFYYTWL